MQIWRVRHCMLDTEGYKSTLRICSSLLTDFHGNNGCMNAPQCYIIRTLLLLLAVKQKRPSRKIETYVSTHAKNADINKVKH
jgi:hypothetical protein